MVTLFSEVNRSSICIFRTKEVEWVPFLTTRLVDDFATHLRIFRITRERLERDNGQNFIFSFFYMDFIFVLALPYEIIFLCKRYC